MADIIFPPTPADGEEYAAVNGITYTYDATDGKWRASATPVEAGLGDLTGVTISAPTNFQVLHRNLQQHYSS